MRQACSRPFPARRAGVARAALAAALPLLVALASIDPSALCVLPALALALVLALRRYPGERTLLALSRWHRPGPRRKLAPALRRPRRWLGPTFPRGGLLLACSLADRPPPPALLVAR